MIAPAEVTRATVRALCRLAVAPGQEWRVSPAAVTIAQAAYEPGAWLRALEADGQAVGLMAMIDPAHGVIDADEPAPPPDAAYLWRLLIDGRFQGRGYGRAALDLAQAQAQAWGVSAVWLTAAAGDGGAIPFYRKHGFVETGRLFDDEVEMIRRFA